jgi:hypothetical protein
VTAVQRRSLTPSKSVNHRPELHELKYFCLTPNVAVEWLVFLLGILEFQGQISAPKVYYTEVYLASIWPRPHPFIFFQFIVHISSYLSMLYNQTGLLTES